MNLPDFEGESTSLGVAPLLHHVFQRRSTTGCLVGAGTRSRWTMWTGTNGEPSHTSSTSQSEETPARSAMRSISCRSNPGDRALRCIACANGLDKHRHMLEAVRSKFDHPSQGLEVIVVALRKQKWNRAGDLAGTWAISAAAGVVGHANLHAILTAQHMSSQRRGAARSLK